MADGVIRRGDRWVARPWLDGAHVWLDTFDTEAEAKRRVAEEKARRKLGDADMTVTQLTELYRSQREPHLQAATIANYRRALLAYEHMFGSRKAAGGVTYIELQSWANTVPEQYLRAVRTMYAWAKSPARLVTEDPTEGVRPRPSAARHKPKILTVDELHGLASTSLEVHPEPEASMMYAYTLFSGGTGIRPGEQAALRWGDIDFHAGTIGVSKSVDLTGAEKLPKNGRARVVALTSIAQEALLTLPRGLPDQLVFSNRSGGRIVKANLHRLFDPMRRHYGLPGYRFYDLRHTCATHLLELGLPSYVVAVQLGHSDNGHLVEQTYGHPSVANALDRIREADSVAHRGRLQALPVASRSHEGGSVA